MKIPWANPYFADEELDEVIDTVKSTWLTMGQKVKQFEDKISNFIGVKHCIAVNSGTAALDVALKVLNIQPGDEVIVPAMAYIATANAVLYQHATPIFTDVDEKTYNMDPNDVVKKITGRTKCILPIDYGGQGADFDALRKIADEHNLFLVEDGAPGFGGEYRGKKLCSFGHISITSFHAAKVFTTVEGGMLFTDNDQWNRIARIIRTQGEDPERKYLHPYLGHNYRLTDLHAAVGLAQIARMKEVLEKRAALAEYYTKNLKGINCITTPYVAPGNKHAWFLYPILVDNRDAVKHCLADNGVDTNVSWPMPVYEQPFYQKYAHDECPVAERITQKILCLPMYYTMTTQEQDYVIENIKKAVDKFMD